MKTRFLYGALAAIAVFGLIYFFNNREAPLTKADFYYQELSRSRNPLYISVDKTGDFVATVLGGGKGTVHIPMVFKRQENPLTCETAALRMSLNYLGFPVSESELLDKLVFSTREPMTSDGTWGDPDLGFVGRIDGDVYKRTGYGVYEKPIADLAQQYTPAAVVNSLELNELLELTKKKYPVIVWGLLSNNATIYWKSLEGKQVVAYPGEHARVVIGYVGPIARPREIILMDPIYGKIRMSREKFLADWETLGRRAVVVYR